MNRKVTVVGGAGNVGATVARAIAVKELADVVIVDIADREGAGHRAGHLPGVSRSMGRTRLDRRRATTPTTADSDVVVITSGVPRKPGMSRDDLLQVNYKIMQAVTEQVVKYSPNCDHRAGRQPARRDVPGRLSAERLPARARRRHGRRARLGAHAHVHRDGAGRFGGEHPRVRARWPRRHDGAAAALLDRRRHPAHRAAADRISIDAICTRTANGGAEITKLVGTSAWYAPGAAAAEMVEAILKDKKKILPCSVFLQGEYGVNDLFVGVPVKLGARGVGEDHRDQADARRAGAAEEVGGGREVADRGHRRLASNPAIHDPGSDGPRGRCSFRRIGYPGARLLEGAAAPGSASERWRFPCVFPCDWCGCPRWERSSWERWCWAPRAPNRRWTPR